MTFDDSGLLHVRILEISRNFADLLSYTNERIVSDSIVAAHSDYINIDIAGRSFTRVYHQNTLGDNDDFQCLYAIISRKR